MAKANKFEQLIEYIINEDQAAAKALFHQIVVDKSRDIYESLVEDDQFPVQDGQDAESLGDELEDHDETIDGDEVGSDNIEDEGDEFGGEDDLDAEGEGSVEDRVMDLEDAIDELKAEFDSLMADEKQEEENVPGIHDADGEDEFGDSEGDEFDSEESDIDSEELPAEDDEEEFEESASIYGESRKSPADLMREYVEKVTTTKPVEGDAVGASSEKVSVNKKSTQISGKNDMGGSSANIARGGAEQAPDGTSPKKASNYGTKGQGNLPGAGNFENRPGAKAGQAFKKAAKPASKEGAPAGAKATMGGTVSDRSIEPGGKPGFKG